MSHFVIDASVAIKWVVPEEGSIEALELLFRAHRLYAPDLLLVECANILWKKTVRSEIDVEEADIAARLLEGAAVEILPTRHLLRRAVALANKIAHPAHDCLYLAVAQERGQGFVTADERLVRKLGQRSASDVFDGSALTLHEALRSLPADEP